MSELIKSWTLDGGHGYKHWGGGVIRLGGGGRYEKRKLRRREQKERGSETLLSIIFYRQKQTAISHVVSTRRISSPEIQ